MDRFDYDFFVIGAGSGGVRAARVAASLGARVAVAEERYFGGTCVNVGCVPKKLFSYAAHFRDDFEDSRGFGWQLPEPTFDWPTLLANKDTEIRRLNDIYKSILDKNEVTVFEARATLAGPHEVQVGDKRVTARAILLAVGGWPWVPDYPGREHAITSNELFHLPTLPKHMVIHGAGYIAVEFASIFARLGVEISLVFRRDKVLRGFDADVRQFVTTELERDVRLYREDDIQKIEKNGKDLCVFLKSGTELGAGQVLSATGRWPHTANLGLEHVNVRLSSSGGICVNDAYQTDEPSVYAVGDVIERVALTPVALAEAEIVARALFGNENTQLDYQYVASAVFCQPNVGSVGLTEEQAREKELDFDVYISTVKPLKQSLSPRDERALLKMLVDRDSDRVIGLHIAAPDAGELIQGFSVAINAGATKADFDRTLGIHPTLAEELVTMRSKRT
ncbi:MAG: glutathione-disulfide reductase, partial [Pseudohongiellaceae bacterium]